MKNNAPRLPIDEAAAFLKKCGMPSYSARCIAFWRGLHGDSYADAIKAKLAKK